jgi:serine/threonine protein kinase
VELRNADNRRRAEDVIERTTTPMFRSPEMIDLHMTRRLTESTDVWALGCLLYSLAYLGDCFEEGSSLAILSRRYRIPEDNPYGDDLVDLIDRMLAWDYRERADMGEVIMCLSALYSNRPLPKRRRRVAQEKARDDGGPGGETRTMGGGGSYRTDGQGIKSKSSSMIKKMIPEAKKLDPNSAAAKRKKANEVHKKSRSSTLPSRESSRSRPDDGITASNAAAAMPGTSSADDVGGFDDFASFDDGVFDNGSSFDDSMLNYDTIETTLDETTNAANINDGGGSSFSYAFGDKCQISIIATSSSGGGDDNATGGDISFRE